MLTTLMSHTVHAMQMMLRLCDKLADGFDIKFNSIKSVTKLLCVLVRGVITGVFYCSLIVMILRF